MMLILDDFDRFQYDDSDLQPEQCLNCGRDLLSWEVDTRYCDICTEQWLNDLAKRDDLVPTDEREDW